MVKTHCGNFVCQREAGSFWTRLWRDKSSELSARLGSCVALWLGWWSAALSPRIPGFGPRPVNKVSLGQFCPSPSIFPLCFSSRASYSRNIHIHLSPTEYSLSNWRESFNILLPCTQLVTRICKRKHSGVLVFVTIGFLCLINIAAYRS